VTTSTIYPVQVTLPTGRFQGSFRFTSNLGFQGCEGFVRPGVLSIDGHDRPVQVKTFFKQSYDDRGDDFIQDPEQKVRESYRAFERLGELGFKVLPFYGMMEVEGASHLLMTDLREGETVEVYDEKQLHRGREALNIIDGEEVRSDTRESLQGMENWNDIQLEMMRTELLSRAYNVELGFPGGTAHMFTRDPRTNRGDIFVSDVGGFREARTKYTELIDNEAAVAFPQAQIASAYAALMARHHPSADAEGLFRTFVEDDPLRWDFMELAFRATVGLALRDFVGGWAGAGEWAERVYPKNEYPEDMMKSKLHFWRISESFATYAGRPLLETGREARDRFVDGGQLLLGIDFAYLAALDARMMYVDAVRHAVNTEMLLWLPRLDAFDIEFAEDGLPAMNFFERHDEPLNERHLVTVYGEWKADYDSRERHQYALEVELDWKTAMRVKSSMYKPAIEPEQIKGLALDGKPVRGFDPSKIAVHRAPPDWRRIRDDQIYVYGNEIIYRALVSES